MKLSAFFLFALLLSSPAMAESVKYIFNQDTSDKLILNKGVTFGVSDINDAAFAVQAIDSIDIIEIDGKRAEEYHVFRVNGDSPLTQDSYGNYVSRGFWQGMLVDVEKLGDGSGHAFTANVQLGRANRYNEGGAFQGRVTNTGSTNGYLSFSEGIVDDGGYKTRMATYSGRIMKTHKDSEAIGVDISGEGVYPIDAVLRFASPSGQGAKKGIDLSKGGTMPDGAIILPKGTKIKWVDSQGRVVGQIGY